jgi:CHAD domain-containing protein
MNAQPNQARFNTPAGDIHRLETRAASYRRGCLQYARSLEKTAHADTVHKLRTHLRRLQSYAEFMEYGRAADRLGRAVSWFSHLRALHELHRYLRCMGAAAKDLRCVRKALLQEQECVRRAQRPNAVQELLAAITVERLARPVPFIMKRLEQSQVQNRTKLHDALADLPSKPKRKQLHKLRLLVKSLRYQQEISVQAGWGNPKSVEALKRLQNTLGKYNDRHQFLRLAKELSLGCRKAINKDRRRSRACARRAVRKLISTHMQPILPLRRPMRALPR